jgi:hypothetical protein
MQDLLVALDRLGEVNSGSESDLIPLAEQLSAEILYVF